MNKSKRVSKAELDWALDLFSQTGLDPDSRCCDDTDEFYIEFPLASVEPAVAALVAGLVAGHSLLLGKEEKRDVMTYMEYEGQPGFTEGHRAGRILRRAGL